MCVRVRHASVNITNKPCCSCFPFLKGWIPPKLFQTQSAPACWGRKDFCVLLWPRMLSVSDSPSILAFFPFPPPPPPPPCSSFSLLGWCRDSSLTLYTPFHIPGASPDWAKDIWLELHVSRLIIFTCLTAPMWSHFLTKGLTRLVKHIFTLIWFVKLTLSDVSQQHFLLYASLIFISCLVSSSPVVSCVFLLPAPAACLCASGLSSVPLCCGGCVKTASRGQDLGVLSATLWLRV